MSKKHKKVCTTLNYFEHFLIFASVVTGRASTSAFASLVGITIGVTNPAGGLNVFLIKQYCEQKLIYPANICWSLKHLEDVFNTSST